MGNAECEMHALSSSSAVVRRLAGRTLHAAVPVTVDKVSQHIQVTAQCQSRFGGEEGKKKKKKRERDRERGGGRGYDHKTVKIGISL
jgi:hypothetical protein